MVDELEYRRSLNRLRDALVQVDAGWRLRVYHQVYIQVVGGNPYVPRFTGVIGEHMIKFAGTVCELPKQRQRTHYRRCQELMNLIAQDSGYGRFYVTEPGHGCRVEWAMELPEAMLQDEGDYLVLALRLGIERLAANTSRFYRLFESTEGYVSAIYDYDEMRQVGRA